MKPLIVAHCGDLQNAPESTLPAFEGAIDKGADTIEFDVHLTRDSELVVHRDYYLGRTNQGSGHIGDYTFLNTTDEMRRGIVSGVDQFSTDHLEQALNIRKDEVSNGSENQCQ